MRRPGWRLRRRRRPAAAPRSTWMCSSASWAISGVSATTAATPSPVHLTSSVARARGVLTLFWRPAEPPAGQAIGQRVVGDVGAGEDGHHAGHRGRGRGVDGQDPGVGVWAAQDRQVGHARHLDVVEIAALAGDEALVLPPLERSAHDLLGRHGVVPPRSLRRWWRRRRAASWLLRGWRRRCSGSRCNGRCCPRWRGGWPRPRGPDRAPAGRSRP